VTAGSWIDVSSGIQGGLVSVAAAVPGQDKVIAMTGPATFGYFTATAWSSTDGGSTWTKLGTGAHSQTLGFLPIGITFDPKNTNVFWVYGPYTNAAGGTFMTSDGGTTFTAVQIPGESSLATEDVAIDAGSNTVLATEHERSQSLFKSTDGGQTWTSIGSKLPAGTAYSQYVYIVNASTYLVGCSFAADGAWDNGGSGTTKGIYRTTDGGTTWTQVAANYEVFGSPNAANGAIYWPYYINNAYGGILQSTDNGASWTVLTSNTVIWSAAPQMLSSGLVASLNLSGNAVTLTPGSGSLSALDGSNGLDNYAGLTYDSVRNSLFSWQFTGVSGAGGSGIKRLDLKNN
jgi:photosystem II stability/assembly factor-like uncharacterized protein